MGSRSTNLRTKIIALLASLTALWAFAAWVTVRDGFNLLGVQTLNARVFEPSDPLLQELQAERRLSLRYLGESDPSRLRSWRPSARVPTRPPARCGARCGTGAPRSRPARS
ncbi:hypothetical protein V2I01_00925 [Micromonospora sp. BRA006-A]|nr:hypothetical protein [Micromonospora sp. BRA006-A]